MSSKRLNSLSDYARHGYKLRLDCECGRVVLLEPRALLQACYDRRLPHHLDAVTARLRCSKCGKRPHRIGPGFGD